MDDLISRAYVLAEYDRQHKGPPGGARKIMEEAPAVDAVPVVHARWKDYKDEHQCSACKEIVCVDPHAWKDIQFNFCPYCGAEMDGESDG